MLSDRWVNNRIVRCIRYNEIFENKKYKISSTIWTKELNIFSLYELFLTTIFHQSLLSWNKNEALEEELRNKLYSLNISSSSNLYFRLLDTINSNTPNSFDLEDFLYLSENFTLDDSRKRIIPI